MKFSLDKYGKLIELMFLAVCISVVLLIMKKIIIDSGLYPIGDDAEYALSALVLAKKISLHDYSGAWDYALHLGGSFKITLYPIWGALFFLVAKLDVLWGIFFTQSFFVVVLIGSLWFLLRSKLGVINSVLVFFALLGSYSILTSVPLFMTEISYVSFLMLFWSYQIIYGEKAKKRISVPLMLLAIALRPLLSVGVFLLPLFLKNNIQNWKGERFKFVFIAVVSCVVVFLVLYSENIKIISLFMIVLFFSLLIFVLPIRIKWYYQVMISVLCSWGMSLTWWAGEVETYVTLAINRKMLGELYCRNYGDVELSEALISFISDFFICNILLILLMLVTFFLILKGRLKKWESEDFMFFGSFSLVVYFISAIISLNLDLRLSLYSVFLASSSLMLFINMRNRYLGLFLSIVVIVAHVFQDRDGNPEYEVLARERRSQNIKEKKLVLRSVRNMIWKRSGSSEEKNVYFILDPSNKKSFSVFDYLESIRTVEIFLNEGKSSNTIFQADVWHKEEFLKEPSVLKEKLRKGALFVINSESFPQDVRKQLKFDINCEKVGPDGWASCEI